MKKALIAAIVAIVLPCLALAQVAPAGAPPAKKWQALLGGFIVSGEHNSSFSNTVKTSTGSVKGVEGMFRTARAGVQVRSSSSNFASPPDVVNADVSALLGPEAVTLFVGGAKRAVTSSLGTNVFTFARIGVQTSVNVGDTGLSAQVGGWVYVPGDKTRMDMSSEGEASVLYRPKRLPVFLQFGYRNEVFKSRTPSGATPEEVRGRRLGGGVQLGGR